MKNKKVTLVPLTAEFFMESAKFFPPLINWDRFSKKFKIIFETKQKSRQTTSKKMSYDDFRTTR